MTCCCMHAQLHMRSRIRPTSSRPDSTPLLQPSTGGVASRSLLITHQQSDMAAVTAMAGRSTVAQRLMSALVGGCLLVMAGSISTPYGA
jgi:hypothetical protein